MIQDDIKKAIDEGLTIEICYVKYNKESSIRTLSKIEYSNEYGFSYISAFCHTRQEQRTFKINRISNLRFVDEKTNDVLIASLPGQTYVFNPLKKIFKL